MIEVEKKFPLSVADEARLTRGATHLSTTQVHDTYLDTADYALGKRDCWLRERDGRHELKVTIEFGSHTRALDGYDELVTDAAIRSFLRLPATGTLKEDLQSAGYVPFASFTTTRRKFKLGEFTIDLDEADFGHRLGEIEIMVPDKEEVETAQKKILAFAAERGIEPRFVRGKVTEYIRRNRPDQFAALVAVGVCRPTQPNEA